MHVSDYLQIDPNIFLIMLKCTILNYIFKHIGLKEVCQLHRLMFDCVKFNSVYLVLHSSGFLSLQTSL